MFVLVYRKKNSLSGINVCNKCSLSVGNNYDHIILY